MSKLLSKIHSRGYWRVQICPVESGVRTVLDSEMRQHILDRACVQFRGWAFPHQGSHSLIHCKAGLDNDWVGQDTDWQHHVESWQFFQNGKFVYQSGMKEDWQEQCQAPCLYSWLEPGEALDVLEVMLQFTEIFEFASRLTFKPASYDWINLEIAVNDLEGRSLWDKPGGLIPAGNYKSQEAEFLYRGEFSFVQLNVEAKMLAVEAARELFMLFGWCPGPRLLNGIQADLLYSGTSTLR